MDLLNSFRNQGGNYTINLANALIVKFFAVAQFGGIYGQQNGRKQPQPHHEGAAINGDFPVAALRGQHAQIETNV